MPVGERYRARVGREPGAGVHRIGRNGAAQQQDDYHQQDGKQDAGDGGRLLGVLRRARVMISGCDMVRPSDCVSIR